MTVAQRKIPAHLGERQFSIQPVMDLIYDCWEGSVVGSPGSDGDVRANLVSRTARMLGVDPQNIHRWRHYGLGIYQADVIAVILGRHPIEIWPDWYALSAPTEEEVAASEDVELAKRRRRRREAQQRKNVLRAAFRADPHAWERNAPRREVIR